MPRPRRRPRARLDAGPVDRRARAAGPPGREAPAPLAQPTTMTTSPRAGIVPSARQGGQLAERPAHDLLVELGQLAADGARAVRRRRPPRGPQRRRDPPGRLEQDAPALVGGDRRQALAPLAPAPRQEPLERPARPGDAPPTATAASTADAPGIGDHASARRRPGRHQPLARVADDGRARVGDERQVRAATRGAPAARAPGPGRSARGSSWSASRSRSGRGAGA